MTRPTVFTCPDCGARSHHPQDIANNYCGRCHEYKDLRIFATNNLMTPIHDGHLWVAGQQCDTCYLRPENPTATIIGPMLRDTVHGDETLITCRETYDGPRAVCRAFYDLYGENITMYYMAKIAGLIAYTEQP